MRIPAAPVADTLKRAQNGVIQETVPRDALFRAQTPQAFRFEALLAAHEAGVTGATDDASLLEALGQDVAIVPGSEDNIKLTYPDDLDSDVAQDDQTADFSGVKVIVDPSSAQLLTGATLDYKDGLQQAGFAIDNPNATRTCGCGQSFS